MSVSEFCPLRLYSLADTDKMGHESTVPISPPVRAALERILVERPGIGAAPLFPSPGDPAEPMTRHLADKWLRKAEKLAGVESQKGPSKVGHRTETPI